MAPRPRALILQMHKNNLQPHTLRNALIFLLLLVGASSIAQQPFTREIPLVQFTDAALIDEEKHDYSILNTAVDLINASTPGSEITICIFKLNYDPMIRALDNARDRKVAIKLILNHGETSDEANNKTNKYFKEEYKDYHYIENDISKNSIVHNKFILFSKVITDTGVEEEVIFQTSSNFTKKDCKKIQDLVVFSNDVIYGAYKDYWHEIKELSASNDLADYNYFKVSNQNDKITAYFFPKRSKGKSVGKDNIETILKNITEPSSATISFIHGKWSKKRTKIIDELAELVSEGAHVEIITNDNLDHEIIEKLNDLDATIIYLDPDEIAIHTKIMFLKGEYKGSFESVVWTGTHNFTNKSLRKNFEVVLRVKDYGMYKRYDKFKADLIQYAENN